MKEGFVKRNLCQTGLYWDVLLEGGSDRHHPPPLMFPKVSYVFQNSGSQSEI